MILVTGGAGFIGSLIVKELNDLGRRDILIVDKLGFGEKWKNLRGLKYEEFVHAEDFFSLDSEELYFSLKAIYHMGASSGTTVRDMDFLMENNVNFSKDIFSLAVELNIPLIYASSAATYGDGQLGYSDDHEGIPKLMSLNPYGYSKQIFDEWVLRQEKYPPLWFGLKFFNVYGPNEYHKGEMKSLVAKAYEQILSTGKVRLFKSYKESYEDGKQLRDFIYGIDCARAMVQLMDLKEGSGIYNIGTGVARSFFDLVDQTFRSMGKKTEIEYIEMPVEIRSHYQYYTQADMEKFRRILPQFKFSTLEEGVCDYVSEYLMKSNCHC